VHIFLIIKTLGAAAIQRGALRGRRRRRGKRPERDTKRKTGKEEEKEKGLTRW